MSLLCDVSSPSPRPSPAGRGRIADSPSGERSPARRTRWEQFPLSRRERAGVRGRFMVPVRTQKDWRLPRRKRLCPLLLCCACLVHGVTIAELSLSSLGQRLDVLSDADPLALKPGGPHVTGTVVTKDLPGSGKFYRVAFKPGR